MSHSLLNSKVILINIEANSQDEALIILAKKLEEVGCVKNSFKQAILDREAEFSTGLPGYGRGIAIPHADPQHVITSVMAIATLNKSVHFRMMGNHDELIDVEVIFMLALKESHSHMSVVQSLMDVIKNKRVWNKIKEAATPEELYSLMSAHIA